MLTGEVQEMLKAHDYDEIQTFTNYDVAKEQFQKGSLQTVVEEDREGEVATWPGREQVNIHVQGNLWIFKTLSIYIATMCYSNYVESLALLVDNVFSVFEDEADEDFDRNSEIMDKDRLEYLKKQWQSRQLHSKALAATCQYMKDNMPAGGGSKPGTALDAHRGSMAIQARRGSVMVVPPKHIQCKRTDLIF